MHTSLLFLLAVGKSLQHHMLASQKKKKMWKMQIKNSFKKWENKSHQHNMTCQHFAVNVQALHHDRF